MIEQNSQYKTITVFLCKQYTETFIHLVYNNIQFYFILVLEQGTRFELSMFLNYPFTTLPTITLDNREYTITRRF